MSHETETFVAIADYLVAIHQRAKHALELELDSELDRPSFAAADLADSARLIERVAQVVNSVARIEFKLDIDPRLELLLTTRAAALPEAAEVSASAIRAWRNLESRHRAAAVQP